MRPLRRPAPALAAALLSLALARTAAAQDVGEDNSPLGSPSSLREPGPNDTAPPLAKPAPAADDGTEGPIGFEADTVAYDQNADTVTATGNVVLRRQQQSARADTVTWNQTTGKILATGSVRMIDENGNQLFTDRVELTDQLKTGAMQSMLLALREGGRIAANSGERDAQGNVVLTHAAYTACAIEDAKGCPKSPSWRVTAEHVTYDPDSKRITFRGARLEVFGLVRLPLPGLSINSDGRPSSGFLVPNFRFSRSNGFEVDGSYYWRIADNRDLTATGYVFSDAPPMASAQFRALTDLGAFQITGYVTTSQRIAVSGDVGDTGRELRGYIFANGRLQLSPNWSFTASLRRASDRTFLRRYDISREDRLRSTFDIERIDDNSYLSIAGWATQTLRVADAQGQVPLALPEIDYRRRLADPLLGGRVELQLNSLAIGRTDGQDTQRAFARAQWDLRRITPWGQEVTFTALARGDVYHSDDNALTVTPSYRGNPGWEARAVALAAVDVKWPLVGAAFGGTQVLTPHVQLVASPPVRNLAVPNEDARAIDLEDSNLFALMRFPGYDRVEDGVRFTYGFDYQLEFPRWRIATTIGQSYRLSRQATIAPDGTGLSSRTSDIVGRTEVRYRDFLELTHRFRLDKDTLAIRRNEFDATIGGHRSYFEVGYVKLNRNIDPSTEGLRDREEVRAAVRLAFRRYWSVFGSGVVNLTDRKDDPVNGSDGFQPLRTRLGVAYADDCIEVALTWRRDFVTTGDARKGDIFALRFDLKNIGFH